MNRRTVLTAQLLTLLGDMKSASKWTDNERAKILTTVSNWTEELLERVNVKLASSVSEWRPSADQVIYLAAELAYPYPTLQESINVLNRLSSKFGQFGRTHPERPSIRLQGAPKFPHPLLGRIVTLGGGWGEFIKEPLTTKRLEPIYSQAQNEWRERAIIAIRRNRVGSSVAVTRNQDRRMLTEA